MSEKLRTIKLYGTLGKRFGRVHQFVCNDAAGAVRALRAMIPGFHQFLSESKDKGLGYAVFLGKENINEEGLTYPAGEEDIRIAPVILGSGRGGLFSIILGAALIGASFIPGLNTAVWAGASATWSSVSFVLGAALALGGVAQLMTRQPQGLTGVESPDNGASYNFNGPVNVTAQGNPIPMVYGEVFTGSVVISGDMYSEDIR